MKFKVLTILSLIIVSYCASAQSDLIFKSGFEFVPRMNDTGITWAGRYPSGNNPTCTSIPTVLPQDCHTGRDATDDDPTDGHAGFSFTKLDASGVPLVDQSVSYGVTPWACVQDNVTGLVWEVKTISPGIHNKDNTYQWGGHTAIGRYHPNRKGSYYYPSWDELVQGSITDSLCGFNNWRVPTVGELYSIVNYDIFNPTIDSDYFPNTASSWFWSSSPVAGLDLAAWGIYFDKGNDNFINRDGNYRVRLVRSGQ